MNRITSLFGIQYPIIQGGMVWCSGWRLASAVSNAGGLGLLGAGSMHPETLREHIRKCRAATDRPFGVNIPLMYPQIEEIMAIVAEEGVKIVFTSAGNPKAWTGWLHERGIIVAHVVSSSRFAMKCEEAGVDAVVAEGFEAGGHNGREETTTFCLIPAVRSATTLPLIAAGGIGTGEGIFAAMVLGAEGVQIGTRFVASREAQLHENYKNCIIKARDIDSRVTGRSTGHPVRALRNQMTKIYLEKEQAGVPFEELELLTLGGLRKAVVDGDVTNGSVMAGQSAAMVKEILSCEEIIQNLTEQAEKLLKGVSKHE